MTPFRPFGDDGLTFADVLDIVNPLQHIPVIGSLYRKLTGDTIDPAMRIAGGALFGGPIGAAFSAVAVALNHVWENVDGAAGDPDTRVAKQTPVPPPRQIPVSFSPAGPNRRLAQEESVTRPVTPATELPAATSTPAQRQPRRGGWIVALAHGDMVARLTNPDADRNVRRIDVKV